MEPGLAAHHVRTTVRGFLERRLEPGDTVVVAVSGGADSLALAAACGSIQNELGLRCIPVSVDHQLQDGSDNIARQAVAACAELGLPDGRIATVTVATVGSGLEAAAREARYAALRRIAVETDARAILLAHTRDDQAETVLMRLARGSGSRSLSGMAAVSGNLWRPLLSLSRAEVAASLTHYGIEPHQDAHNFDKRFLRVRVRHELMPVVADVLGDAAIEALARSADLLRRDADALDGLARQYLIQNAGDIPLRSAAALPAAVLSRVLKEWLINSGAPAASLTSAHVDAVMRLATETSLHGPVTVAGGVRVEKASGRLRATQSMEA